MINYKKEKQLFSEKFWKQIPSVLVEGIKKEINKDPKKTKKENELIVQNWKNVVVLRATSNKPTEFYIGFTNLGTITYLEHRFISNLTFAMRIGPNNVRFFIFPLKIENKIKLEILSKTTEDDLKYKNTTLI